MLKLQRDRLDREYLAQWAEQLGLGQLLERASAEAS